MADVLGQKFRTVAGSKNCNRQRRLRQFNYISAVKPALVKKRAQPKKRKIRGVEDEDGEDRAEEGSRGAFVLYGTGIWQGMRMASIAF